MGEIIYSFAIGGLLILMGILLLAVLHKEEKSLLREKEDKQ